MESEAGHDKAWTALDHGAKRSLQLAHASLVAGGLKATMQKFCPLSVGLGKSRRRI